MKFLLVLALATLVTAETPAPTESETPKDLVSLASGSADLSTLVTAVSAGGLAGTLSSAGPFTVFAPNNDAFAAVPADVLTALLDAANKEKLVALLTYHVAAGKFLGDDLVNGQTVTTLEGSTLTVTDTDGKNKVNDANVVGADVMASNGVVHVIDAVLIPASLKSWVAEFASMTTPEPEPEAEKESETASVKPATSVTTPTASAVVVAKLEVTGIKETTLVKDKNMQTGMINGFASATGVPASDTSITQIGNTKMNSRKLGADDEKLSITFEVKTASPEAAKALQKQVEATPVAKINQGITAAGVTGITATSSPVATITTATDQQQHSDDDSATGLSDGEKAGIAVGVIVGVGALIFGACMMKPAPEKAGQPVPHGSTEHALTNKY